MIVGRRRADADRVFVSLLSPPPLAANKLFSPAAKAGLFFGAQGKALNTPLKHTETAQAPKAKERPA